MKRLRDCSGTYIRKGDFVRLVYGPADLPPDLLGTVIQVCPSGLPVAEVRWTGGKRFDVPGAQLEILDEARAEPKTWMDLLGSDIRETTVDELVGTNAPHDCCFTLSDEEHAPGCSMVRSERIEAALRRFLEPWPGNADAFWQELVRRQLQAKDALRVFSPDKTTDTQLSKPD